MKLKNNGFTLIELVIVIIVLSAIGVATSTYISTGVTIYTDISERDKELNSTRFAMERLRRDVLNALPNSLKVSPTSQCLTFIPIVKSSLYGNDFPISPMAPALSASIASINNYTHESGDKAVVYLLDELELSTKSHEITALSGEVITFNIAASFPLGSPSKRLYIIRDSVQYCFLGNSLVRKVNNEDSVPMANDIKGDFEIAEATLQRNGLAKVTFMLDFDGQEVPIEQTLHVNNVP